MFFNFRKKITSFLMCILMAVSLPSIVSASEAPFELHFLDVGQGVSILAEADGEYMLLDGGGRDASSYVVSYLKGQGVEKLKYILVSHYDEDHVAGTIGAMRAIGCETVLCPDYEADSKIYASFQNAVSETDPEVIHPKAGEEYALGNAKVSIVGPATSYEKENDNSICARITYGNTSAFFGGDAGEAAEKDMANAGYDLDSDIYVADHHGSAGSSREAFLEKISPSYTVVSCGAGNAYGHPAESALERIQDTGSQLFRTDIQGTIVAYSDGDSFWFNQEPCDDWTAGEKSTETADAETTTETQYVCNINSKKFHYPDCSSVEKMKEKNKKYTDKDRDELIAEGYEPCQNCNP